jgi:hypothetical protein
MRPDRAMVAREVALARCRRDGGPLFVVKATTPKGEPFTSETLPPHDSRQMAFELRFNGWTDVTVEPFEGQK